MTPILVSSSKAGAQHRAYPVKHVGHISAQLLREGRRTIAEHICSDAGYVSFQGGGGTASSAFGKLLEQAEQHIHVLSACIEFSSPLNLQEYVRWADSLPEHVYPFVGDLPKFFGALKSFVATHFPSDSTVVVNQYVDRALQSLSSRDDGDEVRPAAEVYGRRQRKYLEALLDNRRDEALRIVLEAVNSAVAIEAIYLDIIQPTQIEVGRLWQSGKISVAQEHYCTAATQFVMSQLQPYFLTGASNGKTVIALCVGDELHEVGLRIVADLFELNGWNAIYLGANAPASSIAETIVASDAQLLAISTTMPQHLFELNEVIQTVRAHGKCDEAKILVGGYPFNVDPMLWNRVGADADACDAREAIAKGDRLVGRDRADAPSRGQQPRPPIVEGAVPSDIDESPDDLSRLNNNLVTLQRELSKANLELAALNKANQEKAEALERADRRKDEFLAMLAHELRGPLAPIELAVALLQMDNLVPSVVEEARGTLKRQLKQLNRLISDLLDVSRIAHGKIDLKLESLSLADVIQHAVEIAHPLIQEKQQKLLLDLPEEPLVVRGDEIRLAQVFANLLTNASKYNHEGGRIWLTCRRHRDRAVIEVSDDGFGIEADLLPDVFATFSQEQRSRRHSRGGLGLGLSLVKQLVELHDGTVMAESEGADKGSVFSVALPAIEAVEAAESVEAGLPAQLHGATPSRRVLIVEDLAGIARITAVLFEKLGHSPEIALDGESAIAKFKQSKPQIVVLDLELPDLSGLDLTREIRRLDPDNSTLVVVLTGHDDEQQRQMARAAGCDEYLVKPVDVKQLEKLGIHSKLVAADTTR